MKQFPLLTSFLCLLMAACVGSSADSPVSPPQIVFLRLRMKQGQIELLESKTVPGTLKSRRAEEKSGRILVQAESAAGATVWQNHIEDPCVQRLEYEDPDRPGELKAKLVQRDEAEFTVRLPFQRETTHVSFFQPAPALEPGEVRPAAPPARRLIARIALPQELTP